MRALFLFALGFLAGALAILLFPEAEEQARALLRRAGETAQAPVPTRRPPPAPDRLPGVTPTPAPPAQPTSTPPSNPAPVATPIPPSSPTPAPSPAPAPTPTPSPTPTPAPIPTPTLEELRRYALELINRDRALYRLDPVVLGGNPAAQEHAEDMLARGCLSHWGSDGLKPYMRYTLAGGINYERENIFQLSGPVEDLREVVRQAQESLMESPDHRRNILDPWHRRVNLGIAYDDHNFYLVQQFEGDYMASLEVSLKGTTLTVKGRVKAEWKPDAVVIYYDPPPEPLTCEELGKPPYDDAYGPGRRAGTVLPPPPPGSYYPRLAADEVVARVWMVGVDGSFQIEGDISPIMVRGPGVYTVYLWGKKGEERLALTKYSVFVR